MSYLPLVAHVSPDSIVAWRADGPVTLRRFLAEVHERLNPGGLLVLASPYTWLEEHTPREGWDGGFKQDGESYTTLDGLQDLLGTHFERVEGPVEVPFVIRETRRKFQHSLSELTVWRRRET